VWHKFTGDGSTVTLSTCNASTNYDTKIGVFSGSCGTLTCVTANDDDGICGFSTLRSSVTFATSVGVQYYVLVTGFNTASGNYGLSMTCVCNPPTLPTVSASPSTPQCTGTPRTLSITGGSLNSGTTWEWYAGSCGGLVVGTGLSIGVNPASTTTYFVRGVGGCVTPGSCTSITVQVISLVTWYRDLDGDSYGDPNTNTISQSCTQPSGYVADNSDCNDNNINIYPGAKEQCNGLDDDCDGSVDDGQTVTYYRDMDGDSYGNPNVTIQACSQSSGYVANSLDCNDGNASIRPGATEVCDGVDNNCDGRADEGFDTDGDGVANCFHNCPTVYNPDQADVNSNGTGDACDVSAPNVCGTIKILADYLMAQSGISSTLKATLLGQLQNASSSMTIGGGSAAIAALNSFISTVSANSGTGIPAEIAAIMIAQANAIIADINSGEDCGVPTGLGGGETRPGAPVAGRDDSAAAFGGALGLFPNPAKHQVTVRLDGTQGEAELAFVDQLGRVVGRQTIGAGVQEQVVDLAALRIGSGVYQVRAAVGGKVMAKTLVVIE
jgi:hypothetical protein